MRLRTKLSIVLALLVTTLVANVGLSVWSIRFLEKELALPLRSMESVMQRLYTIKRTGERELDLVWQAMEEPQNIEVAQAFSELNEIESQNEVKLRELEALPSVMLRSGISTIENLRARTEQIGQANALWLEFPSRENGRALIDLIDTRHELIERIEGRMLEDSRLAADFGQGLKTRVYSILLVTLVGALAIGLLMVMFIRRWVFSPIEEFRGGALRMAQGDFSQPIKVHSKDELGQLSSEFNRMGMLIQEMQEQRVEQARLAAMGEMAQRTVHNLRTPLAGIRALSETTLDELEPESDLRDLQNRIISTIDRFEGWLKEMLRASTPLELNVDELNPQNLVESVVDAHRSAAESKGMTIELTCDSVPEMVVGDAYHLEHAITAILSNAIEFALSPSSIHVHLGQRTDNHGRYWTLRVANQGPMISADLHRAIFRPYFTTRPTGTGIGLAMCHRVISQHLGRIEVESPLDGAQQTGCAFLLVIPVNSSTQAPKETGQ